jgi:SprT protein
MQFDFLKNLFGRVLRPPAVGPGPVSPPGAMPPAKQVVPLPVPASTPPVTRMREPIASPKIKKEKEPAIPLPAIASLLATSRALLTAAGAAALAGRVQIRWNARLRSTAGMAYAGKALVTLNPRLVHFGEAELDRTLRHELGHLLAHERAGRRRIEPHGVEWRKACRDLGLADEKRTHDLPLPRRTVHPRHFYRCPNCALELKRVRPLRRNAACLVCCKKYRGGDYDARFRFEAIGGKGAK